jgi:hypothetical protein
LKEESVFDSKRILTGILLGIFLLALTAGASALSIFMVSLLVFGCVQSPPEWVYSIVFFGFPIPLIFSSIIIPYMFIKRVKVTYIMITGVAGVIMSCMIFFVWFLILTRYC